MYVTDYAVLVEHRQRIERAERVLARRLSYEGRASLGAVTDGPAPGVTTGPESAPPRHKTLVQPKRVRREGLAGPTATTLPAARPHRSTARLHAPR